MHHSMKIGLGFGLTSGIITTMGLMVGLHSGTHSKAVVMGGILTIAIADAFSDALGIHISEEFEGGHTHREIWESTMATFLVKFFFPLTFLVPVITLELPTAMVVNVLWGMGLLAATSFFLARETGSRPLWVVLEHLMIGILVIFVTHTAGDWISRNIG
ncbi:MAG: hypothetical protein GXO65_06540 [Euryarchaeota archaeon]|nr:hypothetical protein [Euryarchaeota archaeon]